MPIISETSALLRAPPLCFRSRPLLPLRSIQGTKVVGMKKGYYVYLIIHIFGWRFHLEIRNIPTIEINNKRILKAHSPFLFNAEAHFTRNLLGEMVQLLDLDHDIGQCGRKGVSIDRRPALTGPLPGQIRLRVDGCCIHLLHSPQQTLAGRSCRGQVNRDRARSAQGRGEGVEVQEDDSDSIAAEPKEGIRGRREESVGMKVKAGLSDLNKVLEEAFARVDERVVGKRIEGTAKAL